jgi:hypothetical protein
VLLTISPKPWNRYGLAKTVWSSPAIQLHHRHHEEWLADRPSDQECRRILNWLNTADMEQKHQDVFSLYQEGTCSWFSGSDAVDAWLGGDGNHMLWCPGDRKYAPLPVKSTDHY